MKECLSDELVQLPNHLISLAVGEVIWVLADWTTLVAVSAFLHE